MPNGFHDAEVDGCAREREVAAAWRRLASRGARRGGGAAEGSADGGGARPRPRWGLVMAAAAAAAGLGAARVLARGVGRYRRRHPRRCGGIGRRRLIGGEGVEACG